MLSKARSLSTRGIQKAVLATAWASLLGFSAAGHAREFSECISDLQAQAREQGMSDALIAILGNARQRERIIELDRNQPEFTQTFGMYYDARVTEWRVRRGRELLAQNRKLLDELTVKYGVPPQYLVAFWGMETNFGSYLGRVETIDALATLACDERRSTMFTRELFAALNLLESHKIELDVMRGSWAGALGHTQLLPSAYQRYAIDADGDGRADLWRSIPDAMATAANYLSSLGWERELRWGREVIVPEGFDYSLSGSEKRRSLAEWQQLGIRKTDGSGINGNSTSTADLEAALLVPSGAKGPKFLVYDNFYIIMRWNASEHYALSVGILADRVNGAGDLHTKIPNSKPLTADQVAALQSKLQSLGFDPGKIDGRLGPATSRALREYQKSVGATADGFADHRELERLGVE